MSLKVLLGRASSCGEIVLKQLGGGECLPGPTSRPGQASRASDLEYRALGVLLRYVADDRQLPHLALIGLNRTYDVHD